MPQAKKKLLSQWFRVAVEGTTTDGRRIENTDIIQMAKNYNPEVYGARVNLEHFRGIDPNGIFKSYGDVVGLRSEEIKEGPLAGKLALFAQIQPNEDLIKINRSGQKIYTSIEMHTNFAGTNESYFVGLAVTDNPASLGTEVLQFSSTASINPLAARKQSPENLFTAAEETTIKIEEIEDQQHESANKFTAMISNLKQLFTKNTAQNSDQLVQLGSLVGEFFTATTEKFSGLEAQFSKIQEELTEAKQQITEFNTLLSNTPAAPSRNLSAGGKAGTPAETDC